LKKHSHEAPVVSPERMRNARDFPLIVVRLDCEPMMNTTPQAMPSTTKVRIAVARLDGVFRIPIFARIATRPAKNAEARARRSHTR